LETYAICSLTTIPEQDMSSKWFSTSSSFSFAFSSTGSTKCSKIHLYRAVLIPTFQKRRKSDRMYWKPTKAAVISFSWLPWSCCLSSRSMLLRLTLASRIPSIIWRLWQTRWTTCWTRITNSSRSTNHAKTLHRLFMRKKIVLKLTTNMKCSANLLRSSNLNMGS